MSWIQVLKELTDQKKAKGTYCIIIMHGANIRNYQFITPLNDTVFSLPDLSVAVLGDSTESYLRFYINHNTLFYGFFNWLDICIALQLLLFLLTCNYICYLQRLVLLR